MTPNDLADRISSITERAEKRLEIAVTKTQRELFDQVQAMLAGLELDADGLIKQSAENRKLLQKADRVFERAIKDSGYYTSLNQYTGAIASITTANDAYFDSILDAFTIDAHYLKSLQKGSINTIESLLANDGLESQLKQPLKEILNQNVNSNASFSDLLKQVREFIRGTPDREGKLMRYSKQISSDALFNFSRSMQESISSSSGLKWIQYLGGAMDTSREFCLEKVGHYYHKDDVEKWALRSWPGKRPGTTSSTIFIYAGGYNCRHQIIYVSDSVVPQTAKDARLLMKQAKEVGDELDEEGKRIAAKHGAPITPVNYKSFDSIVRKAEKELNGNVFGPDGVKDSVRTTIVADSKNLKTIAQDVKKSPITTKFKAQDFVDSSGYRGYLGNVKLSNGTIGEIQVNTPEMIYAKETPKNAIAVIGKAKWDEIAKATGQPGGLGHKYYEEMRDIVETDLASITKREAIQEKSRKYYKQFYYGYPSDWP